MNIGLNFRVKINLPCSNSKAAILNIELKISIGGEQLEN